LVNSEYSKKVLEVGCGFGRITKYLIDKCDLITACDFNRDVINNNQIEVNNLNLILHDFTSDKIVGKFLSVLLLENFPGAIINKTQRNKIYKNIPLHIHEGGIAIVAFRVVNEVEEYFNYQVYYPEEEGYSHMKNIFGFSVIWSFNGFINEVKKIGLKIIDIYKGESRPAGGIMYYAIVQK
jgi:SAM-dependent methyltransferase